MRKIVLASTSPYRQQLLRQLHLPFVTTAPDFVEDIDPNVAPALLVRHLALGKAHRLLGLGASLCELGLDHALELFLHLLKRQLGEQEADVT